jgi:hypothetical protein
MSIAQLLSINGAEVPRYITVGGRTVFGPVTTTSTGLVHTDHGPVTAVSNHTFHGGSDPVDSGQENWWEDKAKVERHVQAMAHAFPDFAYVPGDADSAPCWVGRIDTGRGIFDIGVFLRRDEGLPFVSVLSKQRLGIPAGRRFIPSPHLYDNGSLCIAGQSDWNPAEHTAATATAWAAHWLAAFTTWRITRKWPVEGVHVAA